MKLNIIASISAILLSACSLIDDREVNCPQYSGDGDENITISFNMMTSDALIESRADNLHDEVDSELSSFEDGIDMKDCAMFVFAKIEGSEGDDILLLKDTKFGASTDIENSIYGAPGLYTVNMTIAKSRLNDLLKIELKPDGEEKIMFRILILANCSSPGTDAQAKWNQINGETYAAVIGQLKEWTYAMSYIYNDKYTGDDAAVIYSNSKKNAPMFGTIQVAVTQEALYYSRTDDRVYMGEMYLLRAIAKVRVVDNIQNKDINGYPKIIGAEFIGSQSAACQLPDNAINYQNGNQVHTPNIVEPNKELTVNGATVYKLGKIPDSWSMTAPQDRTGSTWIGYVPEQKIDYINNDVSQGMPIIRVYVALQKNADGKDETKAYDVPMTGYNGVMFNFGQNILRNHIYTLSVNEVALGAEADLTFSVLGWSKNSFDMDYTETVLFYNQLQWLSGYVSDIDGQIVDSEGNIVIQPWTTNPETGVSTWIPLEVRFGLSSPVGATWSAHLIPVNGNTNAFQFLNNDVLSTTVSGTIDGKTLSDLFIVSQDAEPSGDGNSAKLQVVVTLGNGTVIEAPLTGSSVYKNYTIVQNPL